MVAVPTPAERPKRLTFAADGAGKDDAAFRTLTGIGPSGRAAHDFHAGEPEFGETPTGRSAGSTTCWSDAAAPADHHCRSAAAVGSSTRELPAPATTTASRGRVRPAADL